MKYKIIKHDELDGLEEIVNFAIKAGWQPIGSLVWSCSPASDPCGSYVQTMIKN